LKYNEKIDNNILIKTYLKDNENVNEDLTYINKNNSNKICNNFIKINCKNIEKIDNNLLYWFER